MPKETVGVRMDSEEIEKIDELKGNQSRSEYIRSMLNQDQDQQRRERDREREESNQAREEQLRKEAAARGEKRELVMPPTTGNIGIGELRDFSQLVNTYSATYSKNQLAEMLAVDRRNLSGRETEIQHLKNALYVLVKSHPELDINQPIQASSYSSPQFGQLPVQPQQKETESESPGWIKGLMPIFAMKAIFGGNQKPQQQPPISPELLAALRPEEKCVTITDGKTGAITKIPVAIYMGMRSQGITAADIDALVQKYQQKGD